VLVGHSYGGFVITNAASGNGGDVVQALVYVDAFAPDEGETVFQILGGSGSAFDVPDPTTVFDLVGYPDGPAATQRHMAERAGATITEVAGSHVSMVSNPRVTIDAILAAAAAVGEA